MLGLYIAFFHSIQSLRFGKKREMDNGHLVLPCLKDLSGSTFRLQPPNEKKGENHKYINICILGLIEHSTPTLGRWYLQDWSLSIRLSLSSYSQHSGREPELCQLIPSSQFSYYATIYTLNIWSHL